MNDADKTKIIRLEQLEEFKVKNDAKYATKVSGATANNFAALDANGDLKDSGKKASDFATAAQGKKADNAWPMVLDSTQAGRTMAMLSTDQERLVLSQAGDSEDGAGAVTITLDEIALKTEVNAKYTKPSGGIPKTDLASAVQTSLGKADSALQAADISGKADKSATVSTVEWDSTNKKLTKTINGTKTDVVSAATIKSSLSLAKGDVGLGNVTNDAQVKRSEMGVANGVAQLDSTGKVPAAQLPSFVDDVIEGYLYNGKFYAEAAHTTEITAESGKIYVDVTDGVNKTYRWSGTAYTEISSSLALGETSSTAYRGDRGKTAYDHATDSSRLTTAKSSGLYKVAVTAQGHVASVTAVAKSDITALGIPAQDTTYSTATTSAAGLMSAGDKAKVDALVYATNSDIDALFA